MILEVFQFHPHVKVGSLLILCIIFILGVIDPELLSRLEFEPPYYQITLRNVTLNDNGTFECFVPPVGRDPDSTISERIQLFVFESKICPIYFCGAYSDIMFTGPVVIGLSPSGIIPENNVINIQTSISDGQNRGVPLDRVDVGCYTTQGYDNPIWMMSIDGFSSGVIAVDDRMIELPDGSRVSVSVVHVSRYESRITIDTFGVNITANLLCELQSNPSFQYSIVITTSKPHVQV